MTVVESTVEAENHRTTGRETLTQLQQTPKQSVDKPTLLNTEIFNEHMIIEHRQILQ